MQFQKIFLTNWLKDDLWYSIMEVLFFPLDNITIHNILYIFLYDHDHTMMQKNEAFSKLYLRI